MVHRSLRRPIAAGALACTWVVTAALLAACSAGSSGSGSSASTVSASSATASSATASSATTSPGTGSASVTAPSATGSGGTTSAAVRTVTVTIDGPKVTPAPADVQVRVGEAVRLVVTSATANQVHVHGPDVEKDLPAGTPVTLDLRFTDPGVYEVEAHRPELRLLRFVVR